MRKEGQDDFGSHVKCFERCQQVRGAGAGMFARWAECSPTSESSPLEKNPCPPQQENGCALLY